MTDEIKKLIESIPTFIPMRAAIICANGTGAYVLKSDFDRVTKELIKQIDLERERIMKFSEFTSGRYIFYDGSWKKVLMQHGEVFTKQTTKELYDSKEFEDYLNGLKK